MSMETDINTQVTIEIEGGVIWLIVEHVIIAFAYITDVSEVTTAYVKFKHFSVPRKWLSDEQFAVIKKVL